MAKKPLSLLSLAARFDLPADALAGAARATLTGSNRLLIENHTGLLNLEDDCVIVSAGRERVTVRGSKLRLDAMNQREMLITGKIFSVEME